MKHFIFLFFWLLERLAILAGLQLVLLAHSAGAASTPNYVQGNSATPRTPQINVTARYTAAQTAGNLNVAIGVEAPAWASFLKERAD